MPIVHECSLPDCRTLTMGDVCLEHERRRELEPRQPVRRLASKVLLPVVALAGAAAGAALRSRV